MNRGRLLKLAAHLDTVPPEKFDLGHWICGTTACAVGHACSIPEFRAEGLGWNSKQSRTRFENPAPRFGGSEGWYAVQKFFDLDYGQATALFLDDSYDTHGERTTAAEVAQRIREVVASDVGS